MSKISKKSSKNEKTTLTRFIILPLKKPVAKFMIADSIENALQLLCSKELDDLKKLYKENFKPKGKSNLLKIRSGKPRLIKYAELVASKQEFLLRFYLRYCIDGYTIRKDTTRRDYKAYYYTNRRNLSEHLKTYNTKEYTFVKFIFPVKIEKRNTQNENPRININKDFHTLNNWILESIEETIFDIVEWHDGGIDKNLDLFYNIIGLTENDIKKATLKNRYYKKAKERKSKPSIIESNYDRRLSDKQVFEIYESRFQQKLSYSEIAKKHGISKTKAHSICHNSEINKFYEDTTRYAKDYFERLFFPK